MKFMRSISASQIPRLSKRKSTEDVSVPTSKPEAGMYATRTPENPSPVALSAADNSERNEAGDSMSTADPMLDGVKTRPSHRFTPIEKVIAQRGRDTTKVHLFQERFDPNQQGLEQEEVSRASRLTQTG
ncbi:hypothetical protein BDQ17DRAFT_1016276 [Cyathus striatus]|nr:hypothetical protein BDQ17DRAFT_1016276 [Cyathus striatus]